MDYMIKGEEGNEIMIEAEKDVRTRVKEMRKRLELTQVEFGKKFGIPRRTIETWESKSEISSSKPNEYILKMMETIIDYEDQIRKMGKEIACLKKQLESKEV